MRRFGAARGARRGATARAGTRGAALALALSALALPACAQIFGLEDPTEGTPHGGGAGAGAGGAGAAGGAGGAAPTCDLGACPTAEPCHKPACEDELCTIVVEKDGVACEGGVCQGGVCVRCLTSADCLDTEICQAGFCVPATCQNGAQDPGEADVDCGGPCAPCAVGLNCGSAADCVSHLCLGGKCTACTMGACASSEYCDLSTAVCKPKKPPGSTCALASDECLQSCIAIPNSAVGLCCNGPCAGTCQACQSAFTGQPDGTCAAVAGGLDPYNVCTNVPGGCQADGCMGGGIAACGVKAQGTTCATCASGIQANGSCDSAGQCVLMGATTDCMGYGCQGNICDTDCNTMSDPCDQPWFCLGNGQCIKMNGVLCNDGSECFNGFCIDGVCCDQACFMDCESCLMSDTGQPDGECHPLDCMNGCVGDICQ